MSAEQLTTPPFPARPRAHAPIASSQGSRSASSSGTPPDILAMLAGGVEVVALGVGDAEGVRDQGPDRGLARARDAHHHDDVGGCHA
ncbi:hypothetical protein GCM10020221_33080 [Streptomyces thioluteus]|uniref:Uncharacterized protein n=1 Tax=Streptomyces thioluteus TaxID=66431 RepID=A0ABN3X1G9_STRTU